MRQALVNWGLQGAISTMTFSMRTDEINTKESQRWFTMMNLERETWDKELGRQQGKLQLCEVQLGRLVVDLLPLLSCNRDD